MPVARTSSLFLLAGAVLAAIAAAFSLPRPAPAPPAGSYRIASGIVRVTGVSAALLARELPSARAVVTTADARPWPSAEIVGTAHLAERVLDDPLADAPGRTVASRSERYAFGVNALAEEARATPIAFLGDDPLPPALAHAGTRRLPPIAARAVPSLPDVLAKGTAIAVDRPYDAGIVLRCGAVVVAPIVVDDGRQGYFARARLAGCREASADAPFRANVPAFAFAALALVLACLGIVRVRPTAVRRAFRAAPMRRARAPHGPALASNARLFAGAALASAVVCGLAVVAVVVAFVVDVPLYDEWLWVPIMAHLAHGTLAFGDLWAAQNVHRSIVPTTLAVALAGVFGWHERVQAFASIACALATYAIVASQLARTRRAAIVAALACATLVFSLAQIENWLWGFQLAWFLVDACVLAAFALLAHRARSAFAGALVLGILATYTLVVGALVWPIGGAVLLAARRFRALAAWAITALVMGAIFLVDYHPPAGQLAAAHPVPDAAFVGFVLAYLGAPAALGLPLAAAVAIGALALLAFATLAVRARREPPDARIGFFTAIGAFAVASALLEAVGRAGYGADAALTSRYTTLALDLWLALVGLAGFVRTGAWRGAYAAAGAAAIAACCAAGVTGAASAVGLAAFASGARDAVRTGAALRDPSAYTIRPTRFATDVELLRAARLMPFDKP